MNNSRKVILDLCGGTGSWSKPYGDSGYDVRVITLPEFDVTQVEFHNYHMSFERLGLRYDDTLVVLYEDVYGILAAPPCTEFSLAKGGSPRDFSSAMKVVSACINIIWQCRIRGCPKFWTMENPRGFLRQFMGIPKFTFEHWEYGDEQIKPTDLWGYFSMPKKKVLERPGNMTVNYPNGRRNGRGWSNPKCPEEYEGVGLNRAAIRAITPPNFAKAFYEANHDN